MTNERTYTEAEVVQRERAAAFNHACWIKHRGLCSTTITEIRAQIDRDYPLPKRTVPRTVTWTRTTNGQVRTVTYRGGKYALQTGGLVGTYADPMELLEYTRMDGVTVDTLRALLDLPNNPTMDVEEAP